MVIGVRVQSLALRTLLFGPWGLELAMLILVVLSPGGILPSIGFLLFLLLFSICFLLFLLLLRPMV